MPKKVQRKKAVRAAVNMEAAALLKWSKRFGYRYLELPWSGMAIFPHSEPRVACNGSILIDLKKLLRQPRKATKKGKKR